MGPVKIFTRHYGQIKSGAAIAVGLGLAVFLPVFFKSSYSGAAVDRRGELVTKALGQVGEQVVTSREVVICGVIERWLFAIQDRPSETLRKQEKLSWFLNPDSEEFKALLSRVMLDIMVNKEAETLSVASIKESDAKLKTARLMIDFAALPEWKRLGVTEPEVNDLMRRKLRSRAFLQFKTETSGVLVSDEEAQQYFEKHRLKFGNYPFQQFKNSIKEVLAQERLEGRLKDWFELLKKQYRVRFLSSAAASPEVPEKAPPHAKRPSPE